MKVSIVGAGNVGGLVAMHLLKEDLRELVLIDKIKEIAEAKTLDLQDAASVLNSPHLLIKGTGDFKELKNSDIVVVTAGYSRSPGMKREDLLEKNSFVIKEIAKSIRRFAPSSLVIMVTNPVDIMCYLAKRITGFKSNRIFGLSSNLDAARFRGIIARELNYEARRVKANVIGEHGENMVALWSSLKISGLPNSKRRLAKKKEKIIQQLKNRGAKIVSLLGRGSAYFAPSLAILKMLEAILKDRRNLTLACAYLDGDYGLKDLYIGVPVRLGRRGIAQVLELNLSEEEKSAFIASAQKIRRCTMSVL